MQQNKAGFQRPDTFELYLNVVLEFTNHSSQVSWFVTLGVQLIVKSRGSYIVEPLTTDSPYYGNLHYVDKRLQAQIIPCSLLYIA